jgi:predicted kinase
MATAHLIHGFISAGKTTFARKLELQTEGVRFTPDEWIVRLYGVAPPEEDFKDCLANVTRRIWPRALQLLQADIDVVLDFGFWSRVSRDEARQRVRDAGAEVKLYSIECPLDVMRRRTMERSRQLSEGVLWINAAAFDKLRARFEPLGPDEDAVPVSSVNAD